MEWQASCSFTTCVDEHGALFSGEMLLPLNVILFFRKAIFIATVCGSVLQWCLQPWGRDVI